MEIEQFESLYSNYCGYVRDCLDEVMCHEDAVHYAWEYVGYGYCLLHLLSDFLCADPLRASYVKSIKHLIKLLEHRFEFEHLGFYSPKVNAEMSAYVRELEHGC